MSKQFVPLAVPDLSTFAKSLRKTLAALGHAPSHVELLNLLAKSAGHSNFQALRANANPQSRSLTLSERIVPVIRHFDAAGKMVRWPAKTSHQDLCLWIIWSHMPSDQRMTEHEVNEIIIAAHTFGDHALLRRSLVDMKMLARIPDGSVYRRIEKMPDPAALALLAAITPRMT